MHMNTGANGGRKGSDPQDLECGACELPDMGTVRALCFSCCPISLPIPKHVSLTCLCTHRAHMRVCKEGRRQTQVSSPQELSTSYPALSALQGTEPRASQVLGSCSTSDL